MRKSDKNCLDRIENMPILLMKEPSLGLALIKQCDPATLSDKEDGQLSY